MASPPRLRLSIGANRGTKTFALVVAAAMIATDIFFVLLGVGVVSDQVAVRAHDWAVTAAVMLVVLAVAIYVVSAVAYLMLAVATTGAWLDGTTLSMRVACQPTSVDLATADIHCGLQGKTLIARDPRSEIGIDADVDATGARVGQTAVSPTACGRGGHQQRSGASDLH